MTQRGCFFDVGQAAADIQGGDVVPFPAQVNGAAVQGAVTAADGDAAGAVAAGSVNVVANPFLARQIARQDQALVFIHDQQAVCSFYNGLVSKRRVLGNAGCVQRTAQQVDAFAQISNGFFFSGTYINIVFTGRGLQFKDDAPFPARQDRGCQFRVFQRVEGIYPGLRAGIISFRPALERPVGDIVGKVVSNFSVELKERQAVVFFAGQVGIFVAQVDGDGTGNGKCSCDVDSVGAIIERGVIKVFRGEPDGAVRQT